MKKRRNKHFLPLSEWTVKELEDSIKYISGVIAIYTTRNESYKDFLARLTVERSSRIGKNGK